MGHLYSCIRTRSPACMACMHACMGSMPREHKSDLVQVCVYGLHIYSSQVLHAWVHSVVSYTNLIIMLCLLYNYYSFMTFPENNITVTR